MNECAQIEDLLSPFEAEELTAAEAAAVSAHLDGCPACRGVLEQYRRLALACRETAPASDPRALDQALVAIKAELAAAGAGPAHEVLTLEEVAAFLRVDLDDLASELETLPVFTIGGRPRVRRERLLQWIEERERHAHGHSLLDPIGRRRAR